MNAPNARAWLLAALTLSPLAASAQTPPRPAVPPRPPMPASTATTLRMRFVAGQRTPYVTTTTQIMNGPAGRMQIQTRTETETLRVAPDDTASQRMRVTRVDVTGESVPASVRQRLSSALNGIALEYTQDSRGRVSAPHTVGAVTPELRPIVDSLTQTLDQMSPQLPEGPVRLGESWTTQRTVRLSPNAGGSLQMQYEIRNTLREIRPVTAVPTTPTPARARPPATVGPVAVIDVSVTIQTPAGSNASGVPVTGTGSATGSMTLDLGRAVVERSHSAGTMQLHLDVAGRTVNVDSRFENDMRAE